MASEEFKSMVMDESRAVQKYRSGIQRIGIDAYRRAAQESSASGAAQILEDAKTDDFSVDSFAEEFRDGY